MKRIYMCHPVRGETIEETEANIARAKRWVKWICEWYPNVLVVSQWILDCEANPEQETAGRAAGMIRNAEFISTCHGGWLVGGEVSDGMCDEVRMVYQGGGTIRDLTYLGNEPPEGYAELPPELVRVPRETMQWKN